MSSVVTFNDISNKDIGLTIVNFSIQPPSKTKVKETVPFMNGEYDFSTIGSCGDIVYGTRNIKVKFNLVGRTKAELYTQYTEALRWLEDTSKGNLNFDFMPEFYFQGEVENVPSFEEAIVKFATLEVEFICDPFKISTSYMGDDIWDTFNFLTDYTQYTNEFIISGSTTVTMYNNGRNITPNINVDSAMTVTFNGQTYNLNIGDNTLWGLKLKNGKNDLIFSGNGKAKILFRWEAL